MSYETIFRTMRFGIISDIHANLPALEAVINDMRTYHVDHIICLGDIIGYGPFPKECLQRIREVAGYIVMGNHEAATAGLFDVNLFHDEARDHILWTREQLSQEEIAFIKSLHYILNFKLFMISHSTFIDPEYFSYIETEEEAMEVFDSNLVNLMFVGHTHIPVIHRINPKGQYATIEKDFVKLNPKSRYIVNPGAVGLSRDQEFSAGYLIFDTDLYKIFMRRVNYSLKPLYDAIRAMAQSPEHFEILMQRFRPPKVLKINAVSKISKSGLKDAVQNYRNSSGGIFSSPMDQDQYSPEPRALKPMPDNGGKKLIIKR